MRVEAERLLAEQPAGVDVSLTYAPSKKSTGAERPADNEQRRAVDYVRVYIQPGQPETQVFSRDGQPDTRSDTLGGSRHSRTRRLR